MTPPAARVSPPRRRTRPRWYFSLRSPYSWLAHRDFSTGYGELVNAVDWIPFWEPDADMAKRLERRGGRLPYVAMSRAKHLYILQDVRRLALARGLTVVWPIDREPRWEVPHLAYLVAIDAGVGQAWIERIGRARWSQGLDICDRDTIARLAGELGLVIDAAAGAVDDEALRERGADLLAQAIHDGVFGVPFLTCGRERFWGLDRLPAFVATLQAELGAAVASIPRQPPTSLQDWVPHERYDDGHAGGCG